MDLRYFSSSKDVLEFAFDEAITAMQDNLRAKRANGIVVDDEYLALQGKISDLLTVARSMGLPL